MLGTALLSAAAGLVVGAGALAAAIFIVGRRAERRLMREMSERPSYAVALRLTPEQRRGFPPSQSTRGVHLSVVDMLVRGEPQSFAVVGVGGTFGSAEVDGALRAATGRPVRAEWEVN